MSNTGGFFSTLFGIGGPKEPEPKLTGEEKKRRKAVKQAWIDSVTNEETEKALRRYMNGEVPYSRLMYETEDVFNDIFKEHKLEEVYPSKLWPKRRVDDAYSDEQYAEIVVRGDFINILRILLARKGYIPAIDLMVASAVRFPDEPVHKRGMETRSALDVLVMQHCAEELKKRGVKGEFVVPDLNAYGSMQCHWRIEE